MRSFPVFAAVLAASGSLATPLKPRSPKVVDVYEYSTKVDVVTVAAPIVTDWVIDEVVITVPAPVEDVTVAESQAPQSTSVVRQENVYVTPETVTEVITTTVQAAPANAAATPAAHAPAYYAPVQQVSSVQAATSNIVQPTLNADGHGNAQLDGKPKTTTQAPPPPAPTTTTTSTRIPPPAPTTTTTSVRAPPPPTSSAQPTPAGDNLPTDTIVFDLHPSDATYKKLVLFSHNVHRQNHTKTNDLVYNNTLEGFAKEKAESCLWDETLPADANAANVGMNIAEGTYIGAANITTIISDMWYNDEFSIFPGYGIASPDMSNFDAWGHFTQVIWRNTDSVGCWSSSCDRHDGNSNQIGSGYFTVCMYWPPANIGGEYADQIGRPEGHPIVHGV